MSGYFQVAWGILKGKTIKLITGFVVFEILVFPNLPPIFTFRMFSKHSVQVLWVRSAGETGWNVLCLSAIFFND